MKKVIGIALVALLLGGTIAFASGVKDAGSEDILYRDMIITVLIPTMDRAIDEYYKTKFIEPPGLTPAFVDMKNIERPNGNLTAFFLVEIEVTPYFGPHIQVGKDRMIVEIKYGQPPKVLEFEHLEDYPLPERYAHLYLH